MKKAFIAILTLLLCFSLFACKAKDEQNDPALSNPGVSPTPDLGGSGGSLDTPIIDIPLD